MSRLDKTKRGHQQAIHNKRKWIRLYLSSLALYDGERTAELEATKRATTHSSEENGCLQFTKAFVPVEFS